MNNTQKKAFSETKASVENHKDTEIHYLKRLVTEIEENNDILEEKTNSGRNKLKNARKCQAREQEK